jgi:hypothetical protein
MFFDIYGILKYSLPQQPPPHPVHSYVPPKLYLSIKQHNLVHKVNIVHSTASFSTMYNKNLSLFVRHILHLVYQNNMRSKKTLLCFF